MGVEIIGADKVIREFTKIAVNKAPQSQFMDLVSWSFLRLLRLNSPVDSGELKNSWREISRSDTLLEIGTRQDQLKKLNIILFGSYSHEIRPRDPNGYLHWIDEEGEHFRKKVQHPGTKANDFLTPIIKFMLDNVSFMYRSRLKQSSRYFSNISTGTKGIETVSNIVGLTGTKYVKRRGLGRSYIGVIRTGKKRLNRRLSYAVRRKVGV